MAPWDILGKAANIAQLTGLDVIKLVTVLMRCLHNNEECQKLEERVRKLRSLLQWPSNWGISMVPPHSEMLCPVQALLKALDDAASLVDSYKKSTVWSRVIAGRRLANQLRDTQNNIDSYVAIIFFTSLYLLMQANPRSAVRTGVNHGGSESIHTVSEPSTAEDQQTSTDVCQCRTGGNHGGSESIHTVSEPSTAADQQTSTSDIRRINIGHEGMGSELATLTADSAPETMSDIVIPVLA